MMADKIIIGCLCLLSLSVGVLLTSLYGGQSHTDTYRFENRIMYNTKTGEAFHQVKCSEWQDMNVASLCFEEMRYIETVPNGEGLRTTYQELQELGEKLKNSPLNNATNEASSAAIQASQQPLDDH